MKATLGYLFLLALGGLTLLGQESTGTLMGTIVDPKGALVPNVDITVTLAVTGAKRSLRTGTQGEFRIDALIPGTYNLQAGASGFKTLELNEITLDSSQIRDLGKVPLQIGAVTESMSVTAEATPVQSSSSERAESVTSAQLEDVTLKGRDPYGDLHLLPGVMDTSSSRDLSNSSSIQNIVINGVTGSEIQSALDGAPTGEGAYGPGILLVPNLDAIAEVRVQANGMQAEYGREVGGTINFITKSGTTKFHGSFHWDHRNEDLNANSFFNNRTNVARPLYRYLILGGSIGGPVYIPKVMPNRLKNKFFFFYSPEYSTTLQTPSPAIVNEPTAAQLGGNFSQLFYASSAAPTVPILQIINDPSTGKPFSNNTIPGSRIDATGLAMLSLLKGPTGYVNPVTPFSANAAYYATPTFLRGDHVARIDANINSNLTAYFRYVRDQNNQGMVNGVTPGEGTYVVGTPGGGYLGHVAWVLHPTMVNETQVTYGWNGYGNRAGHTDVPETSLYRSSALNPPRIVPLPSSTTKTPWGTTEYPPYLPAENYSGGNYAGYSSWSSDSGLAQYENGNHQYTVRDDIAWSHGTHAFKAGYYWEHVTDFDEQSNSNFAGTYNFGSTAANPLDTGSGYANALLGVFNQYTEASARPIQGRHYIANEFYVQDNWKVTKTLTLDYGVRFLHQGPTHDTTGFSAQFLPAAWSAASAVRLYFPGCKVVATTCSSANQIAVDRLTGATASLSWVGQIVPGSGNVLNGVQFPVDGGLHYDAIVPEPRFGFAWNVGGTGKLVIRGSGGIFIERPSLNNLIGQYSPPVQFNNSLTFTTLADLAGNAAGSPIQSPLAGAVNRKISMETDHQMNLTVERSVGFSTVIQAAYVGNWDRHAQETEPQNNIPFGSYALPQNLFNGTEITSNLLRPSYPGMAAVNVYCGCLSSLNFNALQASLKHRFAKGLTFNANYQFSKALGTSGWDAFHTGSPIPTAYGGTVTFPSQRNWFYGPTTTDRAQYGGANFAYNLPTVSAFGRTGKFLLGSWTLSGVTSFSTGAPVSPACSTTAGFPVNDPTFTGASGVRCQVVGDWKAYTQSFNSNFNKTAFAYPNGGTAAAPTPTFGNDGLGIMRQPTWWNQDLTLAKSIPLGSGEKGRRLSISFQAYNVFNHTEFNAFGTTYSFNASGTNTNANTGLYTGTQPARQAVVSARFDF